MVRRDRKETTYERCSLLPFIVILSDRSRSRVWSFIWVKIGHPGARILDRWVQRSFAHIGHVNSLYDSYSTLVAMRTLAVGRTITETKTWERLSA